MAEEVEIGDYSRRFRLAVLVAVLFVLLAALLAVATLDASPGGFGFDGPSPSGGGGDWQIDDGDVEGVEGIDPGQIDFGTLLEAANIDVDWIIDHDGEIPESELPEGAIPADVDLASIPQPPYDIALESEPVPGNEVTVTVTKEERPVPGAIVRFNGAPVGLTNASGQVVAPVPYDTQLNVTAEPLVIVEDEQQNDGNDGTLAAPVGGGSAAVDHGAARAAPFGSATAAPNASSETFDVPTDVAVVPDEPPLPGRSVTATVERDEQAIPNLEVYVEEDLVGVTDDEGEVEIPVPDNLDPGDEFDVAVERNQFAGQATVDVAEIEIEIDAGLLKLPGTSAEVTVKAVDGEREMGLEGVPTTVTDGGTTIAERRTEDDGTASVGLPWSNSVTASATVYGTAVSTTQSGMLYHLLAALAVPLVGLLAAGVWLRRNSERVGGAREWLVSAVLAAGRALRRAGRQIVAGARSLWGAVVRALSRLRTGLLRLLAAVRAKLLGRQIDWSPSPLLWLLYRGRWMRAALLSAILAPLRWYRRDSTTAESAEETTVVSQPEEAAVKQDAEPARPGAYERLLRCWRWLVRRVGGRTRTKTAVEVERRALESGLPKGPVRRLRRAFQDVEYGYAAPDETVDTAEEAVEQMQSETEGDPTQPAEERK
jgi:hypothetical protein